MREDVVHVGVGERGGDLVAVGPNLLVEFVEGCYDAQNNRRNTREARDKFRGWQEFFRRNDDGDSDYHERVHHAKHDQNQHRSGAADATRCALFAAKPKICSMLGA